MNKSRPKGRYLCKVGYLDVYAKDTYRRSKAVRGKFSKPEVEKTTIAVYHGKKMLKDGFKNKQEAVEFAEQNQ